MHKNETEDRLTSRTVKVKALDAEGNEQDVDVVLVYMPWSLIQSGRDFMKNLNGMAQPHPRSKTFE